MRAIVPDWLVPDRQHARVKTRDGRRAEEASVSLLSLLSRIVLSRPCIGRDEGDTSLHARVDNPILISSSARILMSPFDGTFVTVLSICLPSSVQTTQHMT